MREKEIIYQQALKIVQLEMEIKSLKGSHLKNLREVERLHKALLTYKPGAQELRTTWNQGYREGFETGSGIKWKSEESCLPDTNDLKKS